MMKGALATAAAQGGALATTAALGGALPREETAAPALMVAGALHQGNAMARIIA